MSDWQNGFKNLIQTLCCVQRFTLDSGTNRLKEQKKILHANSNQKRTTHNTDFKATIFVFVGDENNM